ncbi:hypothetical protein JZU71_03115, partial [bacterium]|nr:hypothetical protein [bacterium]
EFQKRVDAYKAATNALWKDIDWTKDQKTPEFEKAKSDNEVLLKDFRDESERMDTDVRNGLDEKSISYSITNLLRLGLFEAPETLSHFDKILNVEIDSHHNFVVNTQNLEKILDGMRREMRIGYENKKELFVLTSLNMFFGRVPGPAYRLSGYAKRFLEA